MRLMIPFVSLEPLLEKLGKDTVTRLDPGAMQTTVANTVRKVRSISAWSWARVASD